MAEAWWQGAVIYQIYPRSFMDGNGDGEGDLAGVAAQLDYVAGLGVDGIWLSPFYRSPMRDGGYDVEDHTDVAPCFGTLADAERLIALARERGLRVLLDMVWGHTADSHPWFAASRAGRDGAQADWYVWADPRPDGTPPSNWLSVFGGPAWTWEPRRRQYYLHHFLPSQPALNWRNPAVVDALMAIGEFWLARGVDGLRLDAVDFLLHDAQLRDNPARSLAEVPVRPFGMQDHLYDMIQPQAMAAVARIRALTDRFPGTVTVAELSNVGDPITRAALTTAQGHLHLAYSLGLMRRPFTASSLASTIAEVEAKVPGGGLVWALSNHDVERAATRWGDGSPDSARLLLALLLALRGTVCLYQGDELGLPEAEVPVERLRDPYGVAFWPEFKGRDGCRTPMPWTAEGGFSSAEPWLPIPDAHRALAVSEQEADGGSVLNTLRRLLRWRRRHPALTAGSLSPADYGPDMVAFERATAAERILCLFNPTPAERRLPLPDGRHPVEGVGYAVDGGTLVLGPWGGVFLMA